MIFGLAIIAFGDAVKEGDGQRLFDIYKLLLLIYKAYGHTKYAYVTLLHLAKICAILPECEAQTEVGKICKQPWGEKVQYCS